MTSPFTHYGTPVFYAWHYGTVPDSIKNMQAIQEKWNVPSFATETG